MPTASPQDKAVEHAVGVVVSTLIEAGNQAAAGGSNDASGVPSTADAAALQRIRQAVVAFETTALPAATSTMNRIDRFVLPLAQQLAAALLDWWRRPGAQQEQQLEAAQAAALRSCAYLCCANLGGGGGPAAGQGEGSQWCR